MKGVKFIFAITRYSPLSLSLFRYVRVRYLATNCD